ncbi:MAG: response regulator [Planctomycetota bacterium]
MNASTFKDAVSCFLAHAWGDLADSHWPKIDFDQDRDVVLARFTDECKEGCMRKFSLRLGNRRYPFMKLIFQESLVRDSFFFAVDTHDALDIKETTPDYQEWLAIKDYNCRVKSQVEAEWRKHGVPTLHDILVDVDAADVPDTQLCPVATEPMVMVVDDDLDIAEGARRILSRRGYRVAVFHCAEDALEALPTVRPDLILSDLEMGQGMTGIDFVTKLRALPAWAGTPFFLATAAGIDLSSFEYLDGFLVKPYEIEVLMTFLNQHLESA